MVCDPGPAASRQSYPGTEFVLEMRLAVLEPVEDVGVTDRAVLLQA
jgi:hypothetical protein